MTHKSAADKFFNSLGDFPPSVAGRQHLASQKLVRKHRPARRGCAWKKIWRLKISRRLAAAAPASRFARRAARMLGLPRPISVTIYDNFGFEIRPGWLVAVVGPSGGGKSVLINEIARRIPSAIRLKPDGLSSSRLCPLELFAILRPRRKQRHKLTGRIDGRMLHSWLKILSLCGLAEAPLLIRPASRLSAGQLHRLAVAAAIFDASTRRNPSLILADEFASTLDPATAQSLCRQVRKLATELSLAIVLATPRTELLDYLQPDRVIVKPLTGAARFVKPSWHGSAMPVHFNPARWPIVTGDFSDYHELAGVHYLTGPPAFHKRIYAIRVPLHLRRWGLPRIAAVLFVSPPVACCRGRNLASQGRFIPAGPLPRREKILAGLNSNIECISRVIVHPIFRSAGMAVRLIRHAIRRARTPLVEALAAMGRIHPMFVKAGMTAVGLCKGKSRFYNYYISHRPGGPVVIDWLARKESNIACNNKNNSQSQSQI
ncbi:MAG: ATP-binding cassette domain-containing protein [Planctomycetes bacterium]|nr:ATP-binding cassette domain-containing protein [Planctomycetota bacterium]